MLRPKSWARGIGINTKIHFWEGPKLVRGYALFSLALAAVRWVGIPPKLAGWNLGFRV